MLLGNKVQNRTARSAQRETFHAALTLSEVVFATLRIVCDSVARLGAGGPSKELVTAERRFDALGAGVVEKSPGQLTLILLSLAVELATQAA